MIAIIFRYSNYVVSAILFCVLTIGLSFTNKATADSFDGEITRSLFTTRLKNNKPMNEVLILENNSQILYFFSEVKNMQGKTIFHRWEHHGEKVYEQKFRVAKKSEKLISRYKLDPRKTGEWMVVITDDQAWPIKASMFKYVKKGSFAGKGVLPVKH